MNQRINLYFLFKGYQNLMILKDAVLCVKALMNPAHFLSKTLTERKLHYQWINQKIKSITPKDLKNYTSCYSGFCGPWIESIWMNLEKEDYQIFGPFIPLFVPWLSMWHKHHKKYFKWRNKIFKLMSKNFFYITLSQNDDGIEGRDENANILPDNIIVLSSGGKGHIPLFLYLSEYKPKLYNKILYKYDVMFAGRENTHPLRRKMIDQYSHFFGERFKYFSKKIDWKYEYKNSKFICAPRGYGRNSFRLTEILQTGSIPIYVYNDIIWLPYYDSINWSSFSIVSNIAQLNQTLNQIKNASPAEIENMKKKIINLYDSHFTIKAIFKHIKLFLLNGFSKSDLRCAAFSSIRGAK